MSLSVGQRAPDFDVIASDGTRIALAELRGRKNVVLYFYPADFTLICTREACGFRDMHAELASHDTWVVGVSSDSNASHERFRRELAIPFPLVADEGRALADTYGAQSFLSGLFGRVKRITFVIDKSGTVAGILEGELGAKAHVEGVRAVLSKLRR